ncbi:glycoside hydrolase superfamily [Astrocystis sublimbata]|nr:glycoside hydrolase superfamily [Astrocystis sublimbata]
MGKGLSWAIAQTLLVGIATAIESSGECALATTTIYMPTTIYVSAPNITSSRQGDSCAFTSSTSITIGTSTSSSDSSTDVGTPTNTPPVSTSSSDLSTTISSTSQTSASFTSTVGSTSSITTGISIPTNTPTISTSSSDFSTTIPSTSQTSISITTSIGSNSSITTGSSVPTNTGYPTPTSIGGLPPPPPPPPGPFKGYKNTVYFTNWQISQSNYTPMRLPVDDINYVMYAFADIAPNGTVFSTNTTADLYQKYPDDARWEPGHNVYGAVKQMFIHKKWNRHLKVLLSVGGGEFTPHFAAATSTEMRRQTFAKSVVKLVTDWGFDGVDIDWEYPTDATQRENYLKVVAACREAFDRYSFHHHIRYRFLVTIASPAGPSNWEFTDLAAMDRYVDIWHLMSYDYSGSWVTTSGHQANVFANKANVGSTPLNTDDAIRHYESQGISGQKIVVGLPLFGRSFNGTAGLGQNYTSIGSGSPQPGVWSYKDLPKDGAREVFDDVAKATYTYDPVRRELITYDNVESTAYKGHYVRNKRLGGAFFWEASGDRVGHGSLIKTMSRTLNWLERTPNNLHYPTSQYKNIRLGMPFA